MAADTRQPIVSVLTDVGLVRSENQDSYGIYKDERGAAGKGMLLVVADGMGGHQGGHVASRVAVETIIEQYKNANAAAPVEVLRQAFTRASDKIYERGQSDAELANMGTTCTAVALIGDFLHLMHVGDTRCYLLREQKLQRLTRDQTWVQSLVAEGTLKPEEAETHPQRNVLMQALGTQSAPNCVAWPEPFGVLPGDVYLLCTDGCYGLVDDELIRDALLHLPDPQEMCKYLVEEAKAGGGHDNITVLVMKLPG